MARWTWLVVALWVCLVASTEAGQRRGGVSRVIYGTDDRLDWVSTADVVKGLLTILN